VWESRGHMRDAVGEVQADGWKPTARPQFGLRVMFLACKMFPSGPFISMDNYRALAPGDYYEIAFGNVAACTLNALKEGESMVARTDLDFVLRPRLLNETRVRMFHTGAHAPHVDYYVFHPGVSDSRHSRHQHADLFAFQTTINPRYNDSFESFCKDPHAPPKMTTLLAHCLALIPEVPLNVQPVQFVWVEADWMVCWRHGAKATHAPFIPEALLRLAQLSDHQILYYKAPKAAGSYAPQWSIDNSITPRWSHGE
jgi:hypothetical protein